jgi:long-subunit fatty acid transport protein
MVKHGLLPFLLTTFLLLIPFKLHASIIESTIGAAVVNDATATYYNPAALTLLKKPQLIMLGSISDYNAHFTGQTQQRITQYTQAGSANATTHYYLPSFYLGIPASHNVTFGLGLIYNYFYRDIPEDSMLRYVQSSNRTQDINLVPAIGIKLNECISLGAGIDITKLDFLLQPISGFPNLNIPDVKNHNESSATSVGAHVGFLLKPTSSTSVGFNYRTSITYHMNGNSIYEGNPQLISDHFRFTFWVPARSVFSVNQFVTPTLGFIGTVQYIQWDIFNKMQVKGIATRIVSQPIILPDIPVNFHLQNSWLLTLGSHYRINPDWIIRVAGSYVQSPASGQNQISDGDSLIAAVSTGYNFNQTFTLDVGYAHSFIHNKTIQIATNRNSINGVNHGDRDAASIKLTVNV